MINKRKTNTTQNKSAKINLAFFLLRFINNNWSFQTNWNHVLIKKFLSRLMFFLLNASFSFFDILNFINLNCWKLFVFVVFCCFCWNLSKVWVFFISLIIYYFKIVEICRNCLFLSELYIFVEFVEICRNCWKMSKLLKNV